MSDQEVFGANVVEEKPVTKAHYRRQEEYKEKRCKIIRYNKHTKTLDIKFDKYGIRIKNVDDCDGVFVTVKYKGEIGKPNFSVKL